MMWSRFFPSDQEKESLRNSTDIEIHRWSGPDDPDIPFNWSKSYRWLLTITVCFMYASYPYNA